jgi:uncharacterized membrane protein
MNTNSTKLANLSTDELYFKKKEFKNDVFSRGLLILVMALITIILSIKVKNYALIAVAIIGLQPGIQDFILLNRLNKEIKSRRTS